MRKITVVCVGNLKEQYWVDALAEYKKRLSKFCDFSIIELPESKLYKVGRSEIEAVVRDEGDRILEKVKGKTVISLAIEGDLVSSEQLSDIVSKESDFSEVCFVIGGSYGLDERIKGIGKRISLGRITLPHQLARVILAEQIYRAFTIINNVVYHK